MKRSTRLLFFFAFLLSLSLPVFKRETSDFDLVEKGVSSVIEQIGEKTWGIFSDALTAVKDKLFEDEKPIPPTWAERWKERIYTGFGYGFSPIGAMEKALHDHKFNTIHWPARMGVLQCFLTVFILILFFIPKLHHYIGILALILLLVTIFQLGLLVGDKEYTSLTYGILLFCLPAVTLILVRSSWFTTN
jgi:hypothetical protein